MKCSSSVSLVCLFCPFETLHESFTQLTVRRTSWVLCDQVANRTEQESNGPLWWRNISAFILLTGFETAVNLVHMSFATGKGCICSYSFWYRFAVKAAKGIDYRTGCPAFRVWPGIRFFFHNSEPLPLYYSLKKFTFFKA